MKSNFDRILEKAIEKEKDIPKDILKLKKLARTKEQKFVFSNIARDRKEHYLALKKIKSFGD